MIIDDVPEGDNSFSDKLGSALSNFIKNKGLSEEQASGALGLSGRGTLNTYTHGAKRKNSEQARRRKIPAEVLAKACLNGFEFEFEGHVIVATKDGQRVPTEERQLHLEFTRELDLASNGGTVALGLKKPPGKIELTVSLKAIS
jgi:hypothetical protein